jgi:hypothetical protein
MAQEGALNRWNKTVSKQVVGTAGTKTYIGESYYKVDSLGQKSIQLFNVGAVAVGTAVGTTGSMVCAVVEVSNDNSYWGTLAEFEGGTLSTASSAWYTGSSAWGYLRVGVAFPVDTKGTVSMFMCF